MDYLDTDWLQEYEKIDQKYDIFYKDELSYLKTYFIYLNSDDEIHKIITNQVTLEKPNRLSQMMLYTLIKKNMILSEQTIIDNKPTDRVETNYKLLDILLYNINLDPDTLKDYNNNTEKFNFLHVKNHIEDIILESSIVMFHDLNSLLIIYKEVDEAGQLNNQESSMNKHDNMRDEKIGGHTTRKIYFKTNKNKKTRRKQ